MSNKLQNLINEQKQKDHATNTGAIMHTHMQQIFFDEHGNTNSKTNLATIVAKNPALVELMGPYSKAEVPIAGYVNGEFISRRIDRLYINSTTKKLVILDYKTDLDHNKFRSKYISQLNEYRALLAQIYPDFDISCKILWLSNFTLENII